MTIDEFYIWCWKQFFNQIPLNTVLANAKQIEIDKNTVNPVEYARRVYNLDFQSH